MIHADVKESPGLGAPRETEHKTLDVIAAYILNQILYRIYDKYITTYLGFDAEHFTICEAWEV